MGITRNVRSGENSNPKLQRTRNYAQFSHDRANREVNILTLKPQHKKLRESMQKYGFLPAFPLMVSELNGKFVIKDGQHRFTFAREFGLDVFFVVDNTDISISAVNQAQAGWSPRDYAMSWASQGRDDYRNAVNFVDEWGIPICAAFAMLAGTIAFANVRQEFDNGTYKIRNEEMATRVARTFSEMCEKKKGIKQQNLLTALWACCHVPYFDESRLINTASRRPDQVYNAGTRDQFLSLLEDLYNFGRKTREPLKFDAESAMRDRNPSKKAKAQDITK